MDSLTETQFKKQSKEYYEAKQRDAQRANERILQGEQSQTSRANEAIQ
jgi:hypothetical protein